MKYEAMEFPNKTWAVKDNEAFSLTLKKTHIMSCEDAQQKTAAMNAEYYLQLASQALCGVDRDNDDFTELERSVRQITNQMNDIKNKTTH